MPIDKHVESSSVTRDAKQDPDSWQENARFCTHDETSTASATSSDIERRCEFPRPSGHHSLLLKRCGCDLFVCVKLHFC